MFLIILALAFVIGLPCEAIEDGWKGIRPLQTSKVIAEKILGQGKSDDNNYHMYEVDDAFVQVNYSTEPCAENRYNRGKFTIPKDSILDYRVMFKKPPLLSDLKFNRKKYIKDTSGDVMYLATYRNIEDGVAIAVTISNKGEMVNSIEFRPSKADFKRYACLK